MSAYYADPNVSYNSNNYTNFDTTSSYGSSGGIGGFTIVIIIMVMVGLLVGGYFLYTRVFGGSINIPIPGFISTILGWIGLGGGDDSDVSLPPLPPTEVDLSQQRRPAGAAGGVPIEAPLPTGTGSVSPIVDVTKTVVSDCPPCSCECPKYEPTICDKTNLEREVAYLKSMSKFLGAIARRENAINMEYGMAFPGYSVLSAPKVQQLNYEYNYLKNEYRKDRGKWDYFKNWFTKLTGIPSRNYEIIP